MKKLGILFLVAIIAMTGLFTNDVRGSANEWGYETGGYDQNTLQPFVNNWSYNLKGRLTDSNQIKWSKVLKEDRGYNISGIVVDRNDNLYYSNQDGELVSLDVEGSKRWSKQIGVNPDSSPVIGKDGHLYISSGNAIYSFTVNGEERWKYTAEGSASFNRTLALDSDGTIYTANTINDTTARKMYAINPDGSLKWTTERVNGTVTRDNTPKISKDGTIYLNTGGYLYAFNKKGEKLWYKIVGRDGLALLPDGGMIVSDGRNTIGSYI
jgi:hypothetical protein